MSKNNRTNNIIMWLVIVGDLVLLNLVLLCFAFLHPRMEAWDWAQIRFYMMICNVSLLISEHYYHPIIHERVVSGGDVLRRIVFLTATQTVLSYLLIKVVDLRIPVGWLLVEQGTIGFIMISISRLLERTAIKLYRESGRDTRTITLVGSDSILNAVYQRLVNDATTGYHILGYYADSKMKEEPITTPNGMGQSQKPEWLGSISDLMAELNKEKPIDIGEELYVSLSSRERETILYLSRYCDQHVIKFYYVPISVEFIQLDMSREYLSDIEIYTTHESLLKNPVNKALKRTFDIAWALFMLVITGLIVPFVYIIIKKQSPGPLFFKQQRTGLDGKTFVIYKFRSMHVNQEADNLQASKADKRKFPFGSFMRRTNIDELPQAWNVLKGEMSIVGPRPHMIAHTEMYSKVIDKYMVRHFVKPGMTGWAQTTGFRGETKELWQMEERVRRDIWYLEHWTIWLDFRIVWLTIKNLFAKDKNAY